MNDLLLRWTEIMDLAPFRPIFISVGLVSMDQTLYLNSCQVYKINHAVIEFYSAACINKSDRLNSVKAN